VIFPDNSEVKMMETVKNVKMAERRLPDNTERRISVAIDIS